MQKNSHSKTASQNKTISLVVGTLTIFALISGSIFLTAKKYKQQRLSNKSENFESVSKTKKGKEKSGQTHVSDSAVSGAEKKNLL